MGWGVLGRMHAERTAQINDAGFAAYADVNAEAAHTCLTMFGGEYSTADGTRIRNDQSIGAVYICTSHDSHAPLAIAAAQAGKHILIEKPLALSLQDCEAMAVAVEKAGVWMMPAFKMRYYPLIQKAREFIPQPQVLAGQMMDQRWADDIWPQNTVQGGANVFSSMHKLK